MKCPKCGTEYNSAEDKTKIEDAVAIKEYGMCKDCIFGNCNQTEAVNRLRNIWKILGKK